MDNSIFLIFPKTLKTSLIPTNLLLHQMLIPLIKYQHQLHLIVQAKVILTKKHRGMIIMELSNLLLVLITSIQQIKSILIPLQLLELLIYNNMKVIIYFGKITLM